MSGLLRRLFSAGDAAIAKPKLRLYKLVGKVVETSKTGGTKTLTAGGTVKEAVNGQALRDEWESDMRRIFPQRAEYIITYICEVTDVTDDSDYNGGTAGIDMDEAAAAAAVAATIL